jgi:predicted alpha-1,2-mannosidase
MKTFETRNPTVALVLALVFIFVLAPAASAADKAPVDYVDPMLGTSDARWMLFPGASMPFGMVKLSPDNKGPGWKAGYEYEIESIAGFSHIHSWMMGGLLTMPTTGELKVVPGAVNAPDSGYRSRFSHDTEAASPGYYAVTLADYGIRAELTSTTRTGFQRYTFSKAGKARILFDLKVPSECSFDVLDAHIEEVRGNEIEGYAKQRGPSTPWNEYTLHFVARFSRPFESLGGWQDGDVQEDVERLSGHGRIGAFVVYETAEGDVIQVKTGISLVSVAQARLNLETETAGFDWDFDAARAQARSTWNDLLSKIEVAGGTESDRVKFYTNLYRSYVGRTIWSDVNGKYVDMHEKVQQVEDPASPVFGCDALWYTFWNLNQLWTLVNPEIANQWVRSLLEINDRGGWLPRGPTGIEYSGIMVAAPEISLIVGAYQKGIRNFDVDKAYKAIRHMQMAPGRPHEGGGYVGNRQLQSYMDLGYVPFEEGPVSNTLEYAYQDWCVAQMARALDKEDDFSYFMDRARSYKAVFDPSTGYIRPKSRDGSWKQDFDPLRRIRGIPYEQRDYVEGTAWQFTYFLPHDPRGIVALLGRQEFITRLDKGFEEARAFRFDNSIYINFGNQPCMQTPYLFNYAGAPWRTQYWVSEIMENYYGTGPENGYPGDEDQGQMGAWHVMSAIGLFETRGGAALRPVYEIGSPRFEKVILHLDPRYYPGGQFVIEAKNVSTTNRYVQAASLDGKPLDKPWFYHAQLVDGGSLILQMGPKPNKQWGSGSEAAPPSMSDEKR